MREKTKFIPTFLLLVVTALSLSSCASYMMRQGCEKTNWFQHGQSVAMRGQRLSGDETVISCRKVEAEIDEVALDRGFKAGMSAYCQPEGVFQLGKRGEFFNVEMCDGEQPRLLQKRHADGVQAYCAKSNGFSAGAKGTKYNGICPKNLETAFVPEFNRGRKSYLNASIANNNNRVSEINEQISRIDSERMSLVTQMALLPNAATLVREIKYDPVSRSSREENRTEENPQIKSQREALKYRLDAHEREIRQKRQEQDQLLKENREMRTELATYQ